MSKKLAVDVYPSLSTCIPAVDVYTVPVRSRASGVATGQYGDDRPTSDTGGDVRSPGMSRALSGPLGNPVV